MRTLAEILTEMTPTKPCSLVQLHRYLRRLGIKPVGARQRPQRYPADTARRILKHLGLTPTANGAGAAHGQNGRMVSLAELKRERSKGKARK